jgi:hypothetical protein
VKGVEVQRLRIVLAAAAVVVLAGSSCSSGESSPEAAPPGQTTTASPTTQLEVTTTGETPAETTTGGEISAKPFEEFDRRNFDRSTDIDNEWFPLRPGTQFVYEGFTVDGGRRVPHRVVFTVTDLTKVIEGVRTVVVWDRDFSTGELVESELALFAQDNDGTVWHLGQYPEEYEKGRLVDAPAWIAGVQNARPGISMKAKPRLGAPSYSQGWGPAVSWTDRAQVYQMGRRTCVPAGCYEDVLVMEEFSQEEPDAFQLKYYARGVGNVRVGWRGEDPTKETLKLVEIVGLSPAALAEVRAEALALEKRAYRITEDVYGGTPPAEGP